MLIVQAVFLLELGQADRQTDVTEHVPTPAAMLAWVTTCVKSNSAKGRITSLSPLMVANAFTGQAHLPALAG